MDHNLLIKLLDDLGMEFIEANDIDVENYDFGKNELFKAIDYIQNYLGK